MPPLQKPASFSHWRAPEDPKRVQSLTEVKLWMIRCSSALVRKTVWVIRIYSCFACEPAQLHTLMAKSAAFRPDSRSLLSKGNLISTERRQGRWSWRVSVLCISNNCPFLYHPGPRRLLTESYLQPPLRYQRIPASLPLVADPIWEPASNLIMFPLERTVSLDQIRSDSTASGISCHLMERLGSSTNNPQRNDHEMNVILRSDINRNAFRKQMGLSVCPPAVQHQRKWSRILCISDAENSWFEKLASSWNLSFLASRLISFHFLTCLWAQIHCVFNRPILVSGDADSQRPSWFPYDSKLFD